MIKVCCAIITNREGQILAVQHGSNTDHPFRWEFPGGKIEQGENAQQAIIREIQEELRIEIEVTQPLKAITYCYPNKEIELIPFVCSIKNGHIHLTEHINLRWLSKPDIESVEWAEADQKLIEKNWNFFIPGKS